MANPKQFPDWSEAYAYCREGDAPMTAQVGDEVLRIFPSGASKPVVRAKYLVKFSSGWYCGRAGHGPFSGPAITDRECDAYRFATLREARSVAAGWRRVEIVKVRD